MEDPAFYPRSDATATPPLPRGVTLCDLLDRVLNKGVVLTGEIVISVAGVELLYISVNLLISSVATLLEPVEAAASHQEIHYAVA